MSFVQREAFAFGINSLVLRMLSLKECFVRGLGMPVVGSEIYAGARRVPEQMGSSVMNVALKQGVPVAAGSIDYFKAIFATGLDFELPEDYKHSCPISCSSVGKPDLIRKLWGR